MSRKEIAGGALLAVVTIAVQIVVSVNYFG